MCDICGQPKCCCNEKRINVLGKQGADGVNGKSAYTYVAYASLVVPGNPDVVTGFSLSTPDCWMAVITSTIQLVPVQANFQGKWKKICGNDGTNGTNGFVPLGRYIFTGSTLTIANSGADLALNTESIQCTTTAPGTGKFRIDGYLEYSKVTYVAANVNAANLNLIVKKNGVAQVTATVSLNNVIGIVEQSLFALTQQNCVSGDTITLSVSLSTPNTTETAEVSFFRLILTQVP